MKKFIANVKSDFLLLLRSVPSEMVAAYILAIVLMNLMASKVIFQMGDLIAIDGGILLSWIPFLCGDVITKRYGARATILLNTASSLVNVFCVVVFHIITLLPGNGEDFSAFNQVFGCIWFILLGSTVANIVAGILDSLINMAIGRAMKGTKHAHLEYSLRSYVSTVVGQWIDNFVFAFIVYYIFAPIYWGWGFSISLCIMAGFVGAIIEALMETIFGPIGYKVLRELDKQGVGKEWIEKYRGDII